MSDACTRTSRFPIGAAATLAELEHDPHPLLARLRAHEPVSWVPALDAWLVTRRDLALEVMRDDAAYTVDDPRFSTARVIGPSMLSLDGEEHGRHRDPFARPFRLDAVRERFTGFVVAETDRLLDAIEGDGEADLRAALAGPLAVAVVARAIGLGGVEVATLLGWYDAIVRAVTEITAGRDPGTSGHEAYAALRAAIEPSLDADPSTSLVAAAAADAEGLGTTQVASNAAVLLFGGIETTEGMILNALAFLLADPERRALVAERPELVEAALDESLRLEPAAAVVDRYTTRAARLGGASLGPRELVTVSLAGANRDPAVFPDPDRFDLRRPNLRHHLAWAQGPHVCLGMHLARIEAHTSIRRVLERLPEARLDPRRPPRIRGLVFRKPAALHVLWRRPPALARGAGEASRGW